MSVIGVVNQKGGVGKTTTVVSLAAALSRHRPRPSVLVVDLDPQGHAGKALGVPRDTGADVERALWGDMPAAEAIQRDPRLSGVDVLAGSSMLTEYDLDVADEPERDRLISSMLSPVRHDYDLVLLDLPPGVGLIHVGAYVAADWVLAPVSPEADAVDGLLDLRGNLERARTGLGASVRLLGVLITMSDHARTREHRENIGEIREALGPDVFQAVVRQTTRVREASRERVTVIEYAPKATAAQDYRSAARELITRIDNGA